jgi:hypothetical protein
MTFIRKRLFAALAIRDQEKQDQIEDELTTNKYQGPPLRVSPYLAH